MPAKSKQQQKFFGVVKAMQKGDIPKKGEAGEVADDMTKKEVDKMASTKYKGLVNKIKELVEEEIKSLIEAKLPDEGFSDPDQMREAKSAKSLKMDYEKAIKKEQTLSSLMLANLVKYKQAKASGDEKAVAKYTKIAAQLSPNKRKASEAANKAYKAYEDKISGLHADAELELKEVSANDNTEFNITLKHLLDKHVAKGGEVEEANISWSTLHKDNEDYKYKKYVAKAFDKINDEMFKFRHSMGIKTLTNKDKELKSKVEKLAMVIFDLQKEMRLAGLTESKVNEATDMNDPVLMAFRATRKEFPKLKPAKTKSRRLSFDKYMNLLDSQTDIDQDIKDKAQEMAQTFRDMEQEAEPEGGKLADKYSSIMMKQEKEYAKLKAKKAKIDARLEKHRMD